MAQVGSNKQIDFRQNLSGLLGFELLFKHMDLSWMVQIKRNRWTLLGKWVIYVQCKMEIKKQIASQQCKMEIFIEKGASIVASGDQY